MTQPSKAPIISKDLAGLAALVAIYLVYVGPLFGGRSSFAQFQDNTYMILPIFSHISSVFQAGEYPYWMNTVMGGIPLFNATQFSALYPLYFFQMGWFFQGPLDALRQVHYVVLLHVFLALVNTYALARILSLPVIPAVLAASVFALSPDLMSYMSWVNAAPYAWFPLAVGSIVLLLEHRHRTAGMVLGVVGISMLVTASASHVFIQLFYFATVLCLFQAARFVVARQWNVLRGVTIDLALMAVAAFLVTSPVLVPAMVGMDEMVRWVGAAAPIRGYEKMPFDAFLLGQLRPGQLASALFPGDHAYLLGNPYIGVPSALLAAFAVFKARRNPILLPIGFIGLYGLLSAAGSHWGFGHLNYSLPLLNTIREPSRHLMLFVLCFAMLAGQGFAYLLEALADGGGALRKPAQLLTLASAIVVAGISLSKSLPFHPERQGAQLIACALLLGAFVVAARFSWARRFVPALAVWTIVHLNQMLFPWRAPAISSGDYFAAENLRSHEILREISRLPNIRDYRLLFAVDLQERHQAWAMNASYYGLRTFNVYFNPLPAKQFEEMYYQGPDWPNYFEMEGAKYILCRTCDSPILLRYKLAKDFGDYKLYVTDRALPRSYVAGRLAGTYTTRAEFLSLVAQQSTATPVVFADESSKDRMASWMEGDGQTVALSERTTPNSLTVSVAAEKRSVFVLNEYFTPSWKARVNGASAQTFRVNLNQVGVLLDRGTSLVELEYRPTLFVLLVWLRQATMLVLMVLGSVWVYRRRRAGLTGPESLDSRTVS